MALTFLAVACLTRVVTSLMVNSLITNQIILEAQERAKEDHNIGREGNRAVETRPMQEVQEQVLGKGGRCLKNKT